ncbi:unnamed protein product [Rotaria magnacalcarata]|uniref:Alpha-L-glutamate ligase-related protein ATP-grasp domain-containing protein n=2 Tax=Rotaria magnacalcarata TaxID=392030 RepID=A0A820HW01_9BILA|nr:unnamed protein product [Rotaria magnacalcarata]CAF4299967.1 unnamed protein product [Rotaria magnacalcarata]
MTAIHALRKKSSSRNMSIVQTLVLYYRLFFYYLYSGNGIDTYYSTEIDRRILIHIYSLALVIRLFSFPHYRAKCYGDDLRANLHNVIVPFTGIPLSIFCFNKYVCLFFLIFIYPLWAFIGSIYLSFRDSRKKTAHEHFYEQLLRPNHWFATWRINCTIVAYHSYKKWEQTEEQYAMEDKGRFLIEANKLDIPVTPILDVPCIMIKHKSIEGGMGINIYDNFATNHGDWIIQKVFSNSDFIQRLVTPDAPLSTVRIITSRDSSSSSSPIKVKTMVFRAGRIRQKTDHNAIFYDIDFNSSHRLSSGTTNCHWYQSGFKSFDTKSMWNEQNYSVHPDSHERIEGIKWPNVNEMIQCVCQAHEKLCPNVPIIGWDVAWTNEDNQLMLLELNISCNFFNGHFDTEEYTKFCYEWFHALDI